MYHINFLQSGEMKCKEEKMGRSMMQILRTGQEVGDNNREFRTFQFCGARRP